ncbi:MAG: hypothetical protein DMF69_14030 [Acidobacteria bacterium]|nr:MAG: hypothetical protein DMF69_14030 [Acidobacteriota bacterium]
MAFLMIAGCATRQASVNTNFRRDYPAPSPSPTIDEVARRQAENSRRLNDNIVEYARLPSSSQMTGRPYINGRAIGLSKDPEDKEFELDRSLLDDNLTAESPEEVGTVVLVTYRKQKFGTYITDDSSINTRGDLQKKLFEADGRKIWWISRDMRPRLSAIVPVTR